MAGGVGFITCMSNGVAIRCCAQQTGVYTHEPSCLGHACQALWQQLVRICYKGYMCIRDNAACHMNNRSLPGMSRIHSCQTAGAAAAQPTKVRKKSQMHLDVHAYHIPCLQRCRNRPKCKGRIMFSDASLHPGLLDVA